MLRAKFTHLSFEILQQHLDLCPVHTGYDQIRFPPPICRMNTSLEPHCGLLHVRARCVCVASSSALFLLLKEELLRAH